MSSSPLHLLLRDARRSKGLTQMDLASQVDCTQSAISMMERGQTSAVARPTLEKIATLLGVELPPEDLGKTSAPSVGMFVPPPVALAVKICPNADCPSNLPYRVGEEVFYLPKSHAVTGNRCPYCGEVLVASCPKCGAPLHAGEAFCTECGTPLVPSPQDAASQTEAWLRTRQQQSSMLLSWGTGVVP